MRIDISKFEKGDLVYYIEIDVLLIVREFALPNYVTCLYQDQIVFIYPENLRLISKGDFK